jgi:hypothetical protein
LQVVLFVFSVVPGCFGIAHHNPIGPLESMDTLYAADLPTRSQGVLGHGVVPCHRRMVQQRDTTPCPSEVSKFGSGSSNANTSIRLQVHRVFWLAHKRQGEDLK